MSITIRTVDVASEPETRVRVVEGCRVIGRFTVRRSSPADFTARPGRGQLSARLREWVIWNGKKLAKGALGAASLASASAARST